MTVLYNAHGQRAETDILALHLHVNILSLRFMIHDYCVHYKFSSSSSSSYYIIPAKA